MDYRAAAAKYYDAQPAPYDNQDIPFYQSLLPSASATVLELGCGTGRVLLPLADQCAQIHGVDLAESMLAICRAKLAASDLPAGRVTLRQADMTRLQLDRRFDLITAPFRVFQALEHDDQIDRFFAVVRRHLAPGGSAVLNAFNPYPDVWARWQKWLKEERVSWERPFGNGRLVCLESMRGFNRATFTAYPRLTYRYYEDEVLADEAHLDITMRAYWPDDFLELIRGHGARVLDRWGGYAGQEYGQGPELVVQFTFD